MTGRDNELKFLNQYHSKDGCKTLVVYGQRGIGKTTLLNEFCMDKSVFRYHCLDTEDREQRYQLSRKCKAAEEFTPWADLLDLMIQDTEVVILEDFQCLIRPGSEFLPALQDLIKNRCNKKMTVILCSSSVNWVENSMVSQMKSIVLLLNGMLKVRPLTFDQIRKAFPEYALMDAISLYAVLGVVPGRWEKCRIYQTKKADEILQRAFLKPGGVFEFEHSLILREELRELGVYQTILSALACGNSKLNDIYRHTGFSRAKISVYLKNLMQMEVVEKIFSVETEGHENLQKGLYRIGDPLFLFVYTFLFHKKDELAEMGPEAFYQKTIRPYLNQFIGAAYKGICREALIRWNKEGKLPLKAEDIGEWNGKKASLDLICVGEEEKTLVGYCNWAGKPVSYDDYEWILFGAKQAKVHTDYIWLFSATGFDEQIRNLAEQDASMKLIGIQDMLE